MNYFVRFLIFVCEKKLQYKIVRPRGHIANVITHRIRVSIRSQNAFSERPQSYAIDFQ